MKKIYQQPLLEVVKLQTMQMLAVSVKEGEVSNFDELLAPEFNPELEDDFTPDDYEVNEE
jgi:hypothetical protein